MFQGPDGNGRGLCYVRIRNSRMACSTEIVLLHGRLLQCPNPFFCAKTCSLLRVRRQNSPAVAPPPRPMPYSGREPSSMSSESKLSPGLPPGARNQTDVFAVHGADPEVLA